MAQKFAALVGCIDFRFLHGPEGLDLIQEFALSSGFVCCPITRAGGIQDLVRPAMPNFDQSVIKDISVPIQHLGAKDVFLANHADCKVYPVFSSSEEEFRFHLEDLRNADQILRNIFPGVRIHRYFAELQQDTSNQFVFREVS